MPFAQIDEGVRLCYADLVECPQDAVRIVSQFFRSKAPKAVGAGATTRVAG
jgi:hypothetical protein